jgi:hypothetical protein
MSESTTPLEQIRRRILAVRLRAVALLVLNATLWAFLAAAFGWLLFRIVPDDLLPASAPAIVGALLGLTWLWSFVRGWLSDTDAAHRIDHALELKDRTVSALDFSRLPEPHPIHGLQIEDAAAHLDGIQVRRVVPWRWKMDALLATCAVALLVAGTLSFGTRDAFAMPVPPAPALLVYEASSLQQELEQLAEELAEEEDEELVEKVREAKELAASLQEPGTDYEEALGVMGMMRSKLQEVAASLDLASEEAMLMALANALNQFPQTRSAGLPLSRKAFEEAAENMEKMAQQAGDESNQFPEQSEALGAEAQKLAEQAKEAGQEGMREAMEELSEGIRKGDCQACQNGLQKQSNSIRRHGKRSNAAKSIQQQMQSLSQCRSRVGSELMSQCQSPGDKGKSGGKNPSNSNQISLNRDATDQNSEQPSSSAGLGEHMNPFGKETNLDAMHNEEELQGQMNRGPSEITVETGPEMEQYAARDYRDVYSRYKKLSDEVLAHEALPPGYQGIIKRYFESIRPQRDEGSEE